MDWESIFSNALRSGLGLAACVYALAGIGLNVHFGYTGLLNFGQVGFMAIAAYGLAISVTYFNLAFPVAILVGLLASIILALLLGIPTLRLRADYLAIVTIASSEIIRLMGRSVSLRKYAGGSSGLQAFSQDFYDLNPYGRGEYGFWIIKFTERTMWAITCGWLLVALGCLVVWLVMRSPWGRVLKSIREDEDAARSLGKNVYLYKMQSLVLGGIFGALAGFILSLGTGALQPDTYSTVVTFFAYTALILGGTARVLGPVVGAMIFWFLVEFTDGVLRGAFDQGYFPTWVMNTSTDAAQVRFMLVGVGLMLLMIFRPQGIFGDRRELELDAR
jgi:neutral amino acid transport system permease protein